MTERRGFGQAGSDYVPPSTDDDDVWILKFKVGDTRVRIAPAEMLNEKGETVYGVDAWPTEREHYDENISDLGSYPCGERLGIECPGCKSPSKKTRERSRVWYINALAFQDNSDEVRVRVFKVGTTLREQFLKRQQRGGPEAVSNRDYLITREGSGLDTKYFSEPLDAYPVAFEEYEFPNILDLLEDRFERALQHYAGQAQSAPAAPAAPASTGRGIKRAAAPPQKAAEPEYQGNGHAGKEAAEAAVPEWAENPTVENLEEADSGELKAFLTGRSVEFPERAPRSRLLALAKEQLAPPF